MIKSVRFSWHQLSFSGSRAETEPGNKAATFSGSRAETEPGNKAASFSGSRAETEPGNKAASFSGSRAETELGNKAALFSGSRAETEPGNKAASFSGSRAETEPGNKAASFSGSRAETELRNKASVHILAQFLRDSIDFTLCMRTPTHNWEHFATLLHNVPEMVLVPPPFQVEVMLEPCMRGVHEKQQYSQSIHIT